MLPRPQSSELFSSEECKPLSTGNEFIRFTKTQGHWDKVTEPRFSRWMSYRVGTSLASSGAIRNQKGVARGSSHGLAKISPNGFGKPRRHDLLTERIQVTAVIRVTLIHARNPFPFDLDHTLSAIDSG